MGVERDKRRGQDKDTARLRRGRKWTDWKAARDLKRQKIWKELLPWRQDWRIRRWKNKPVGSGEIKLDRRQRCLSGEGGKTQGRENGLLGKWPSSLLVMGCKSAPCTFSGSKLPYQHSHTWFKKLSCAPKCSFNSGQGTGWQTKRGGTCTNLKSHSETHSSLNFRARLTAFLSFLIFLPGLPGLYASLLNGQCG